MTKSEIKDFLEINYLKYKTDCSTIDPIWSIKKIRNEEDIEPAAFITSCYSYGRIEVFEKFLINFFSKIGYNLREFILNFSHDKDKKYLKDSSYRFNSEKDFEKLIISLQRCYRQKGSLLNLFYEKYNIKDETILFALNYFSEYLNEGIEENDSFGYLIPLASKGSACKRLNLFLRWMVRKDEIDMGLWANKISKSKLIMPVDTHIYRISRLMGFVKRSSADMKFALELTSFLKQFDSDDPVKYDFALCHIGIEENRK